MGYGNIYARLTKCEEKATRTSERLSRYEDRLGLLESKHSESQLRLKRLEKSAYQVPKRATGEIDPEELKPMSERAWTDEEMAERIDKELHRTPGQIHIEPDEPSSLPGAMDAINEGIDRHNTTLDIIDCELKAAAVRASQYIELNFRLVCRDILKLPVTSATREEINLALGSMDASVRTAILDRGGEK